MTANVRTDDEALAVAEGGLSLLSNPLLNKGTAFTEAERDAFGLHGLLPPHRRHARRAGRAAAEGAARLRRPISSATPSCATCRTPTRRCSTRCSSRNIEEMLPLVYTPTVGEGCQRFSEIWRKPRGLFLSYPNKRPHPRDPGRTRASTSVG